MEPIVAGDDPERAVSIRLALDQVVVTESRFGAGQRGPDAHVHLEHADCFYVIKGTLGLRVGEEERALGPRELVLVPPGVVHGRTRAIGGPARFLNLLAPGGLEEAFLDPAAAARLDVRLADPSVEQASGA